MIQPLGKLVVVAAGTPVAVQSLLGVNINKPTPIHAIMVQAWFANSGKIYVGVEGMNKLTGVGVMAVLPAPTDSFIATFSAALTIAPNGMRVADFWIDADTTNDSALVTFLQT